MFSGIPDWLCYVLLLVLATVVAGAIWRVASATWEFVRCIVVPASKLILILGLWIVLILLVNKLELVVGDAGHLAKDFGNDAHRLVRLPPRHARAPPCPPAAGPAGGAAPSPAPVPAGFGPHRPDHGLRCRRLLSSPSCLSPCLAKAALSASHSHPVWGAGAQRTR